MRRDNLCKDIDQVEVMNLAGAQAGLAHRLKDM
jgi:hypothetical protein